MKKVILILMGLLCLASTVSAMGSSNFDLSWNVIGGGGGSILSPSYSMGSTVGQITGVTSSPSYNLQAGFWVTDEDVCGSGVVPLDGYTSPPTDPDGDCFFEDLNANGFADWDDAVVLFWNTDWIQENEPVENFDFNNNGFLDWDDAVVLFWEV
jgi:PKD repeat protein